MGVELSGWQKVRGNVGGGGVRIPPQSGTVTCMNNAVQKKYREVMGYVAIHTYLF